MSKKKKQNKKRLKKRNRTENDLPAGTVSWQDDGGVHFLTPGLPPSPEIVAEMTKEYHRNIKNSPLWEDWVRQFGLQKAEDMLKECRVEIRP